MEGLFVDGLLVFAAGIVSIAGLVSIIWYGMSKMEELLK